MADRIRKEVSDGLEKNQREFLLRQQMSAIRKELGEDGEDEDLVDDYRAKLAELAEAGALTDRRVRRSTRDRPSRAHAGAEHGARVDPYVARHRARHPVGGAHD